MESSALCSSQVAVAPKSALMIPPSRPLTTMPSHFVFNPKYDPSKPVGPCNRQYRPVAVEDDDPPPQACVFPRASPEPVQANLEFWCRGSDRLQEFPIITPSVQGSALFAIAIPTPKLRFGILLGTLQLEPQTLLVDAIKIAMLRARVYLAKTIHADEMRMWNPIRSWGFYLYYPNHNYEHELNNHTWQNLTIVQAAKLPQFKEVCAITCVPQQYDAHNLDHDCTRR
jgi:hypothetical protein